MKRSLTKSATFGLLLAAPLLVAACVAPPTDMTAVEQEVRTDLAQNGINGVDVTTLTLKQLQEIKLATGGAGSRADKQNRIMAIVNRAPGSQAD